MFRVFFNCPAAPGASVFLIDLRDSGNGAALSLHYLVPLPCQRRFENNASRDENFISLDGLFCFLPVVRRGCRGREARLLEGFSSAMGCGVRAIAFFVELSVSRGDACVISVCELSEQIVISTVFCVYNSELEKLFSGKFSSKLVGESQVKACIRY